MGRKKCKNRKKPEAHSQEGVCPLVVSPPSCGKVLEKRLLGFFMGVSPLQALDDPLGGDGGLPSLLHERTWYEAHQ